MSSLVQAEDFLLPEEELYVREKILDFDIDWHWHPMATTTNFPFFAHVMVPRYDIEREAMPVVSPHFPVFDSILKRFCNTHAIPCGRIYRACLNLMVSAIPPYTDPHVDHLFPHHTFVIYLKVGEAGTLLFNKDSRFLGGPNNIFEFESKVSQRVEPKANKVFCFDGLTPHANETPKVGQRRVVCAMTFGD